MHNNFKAIVWMMIHIIASVLININYRILASEFEKVHIITFYNTFAFIILLPFAFVFRAQIHPSPVWYVHMVRALCYVVAQLLLIYVYNNIPFMEVTSVTLTYPLVALVASVIFLKEKMLLYKVIAILMGFMGGIILINPFEGKFSLYSLLTFVAVLLWVLFDILVKQFNKEGFLNQFFHLMGFMAIFSILPSIIVDAPWPKIFSTLIFIPMGFLVILYMLSMMMSIIKAETLGVVVPFYFINLVLASLVGYYIFGELIDMKTMIGSILILVANLYVVYKEHQIHKARKINLL